MPTPLTISHPEIAAEWHPTKNGDFTPDKTSAGSSKSVWWLCKNSCPHGCLHEWTNTISNRCRVGWGGCPFCSKLKKKVCIHSSIITTHPEVAAQWHPTKNGDRKPEQYSFGSEQKAWWLCPNSCEFGCQHEWEADISKRILRGINAGCPFCASNHKQVCIHNSIATTHPHLVRQWHPTKNGDLKPETLTPGCNSKVWWFCENTCSHSCKHEWIARVNDRTGRDTGCPYCCAFRQNICEHQSIVYTHPEIIPEWHPSRNGSIDPKTIARGSELKIWWKCLVNSKHEWRTAVNNRTGNKSGCPYCMNKTEEKIYKYLLTKYNTVLRQFTLPNCKRINALPFDICIPEIKVIIEVDGGQHFKEVRNWLPYKQTIQRDIFKMRKAEEEGYKIVRIYQIDAFKADEEWLNQELLPEIESASREPVFITSIPGLYSEHIELYSSDLPIVLV